MKAIPISPDRIRFRPETDADQLHLERMLVLGQLIEHGRGPGTGVIIHATARVAVEAEVKATSDIQCGLCHGRGTHAVVGGGNVSICPGCNRSGKQ